MTEAVVELRAVQHAYPRTVALQGVSLRIAPGETVAVTGPSGSGKSTLLLVASGILRLQSGQASLLGSDLATMTDTERSLIRRKRVGVILQFGQLLPDLRVIDNVALPLLLDGVERQAARAAASGWLQRAGLDGAEDTLPGELSGGQAQRVAVARALVTGPHVIFADEPTGSMDSRGGELLLDLLLSAVRDQGAALVLVTHDNTVAARADREVRLRDGAVEYDVALT